MNNQVIIDQMNLYDYVVMTFEKVCDLTEARMRSLNYYLGLCKAKYVNVAEFKSVFDIQDGFYGILSVLTDISRSEELINYGNICYQESLKQVENHGSDVSLSKKALN